MGAATQPSSARTTVLSAVSAAEVREQLDRIFQSDSFQRSRRLQRFLSFISELALEGKEEEINEHLIGIEVFERGADYNPSEDSVVRRQAHSLRQKLEDYYGAEGRSDPVVIQVPRGHYVPVFRYKRPEPVEAKIAMQTRRKEETSAGSRSRLPWLLALAALTLVGFLAGRVSTESGGDRAAAGLATSAAIQELWGPWFSSEEPPIICFSSPYTGVVKHYQTPLPPDSLPKRLELTGPLEGYFRSSLGLDGGHLYISPSSTEAKSGEALGAIRLANLFAMNGLDVQGALSNRITWELFRQSNVILLGHSEQNQWVSPILEKYPLRLAETDGSRPRRIVNTSPEQGEDEAFEIAYALDEDEATVEYALVSMLPGLHSGRRLLLVSGLNTQATRTGIDFLTGTPQVQQLLSRMRDVSPSHEGPWHFQLVLSTQVHDKVPTGDAIEMVRVLD